MSNREEGFWFHELGRLVVKAIRDESRQWRAAYHRRTDVYQKEYELSERLAGEDIYTHYGEDDVTRH